MLLKKLSVLFLVFVLAASGQPVWAQSNEPEIASSLAVSNSDLATNIQIETREFEDEASAVLAAQELLAEGAKRPNQTTVVSADSAPFLAQVGAKEAGANGRSFLILNDAVNRFVKKPANYVKESYQHDRIGFVIALYTTAAETVAWIHVAPMSIIAKSATIAFTISMALYFRFKVPNTDRWNDKADQIKSSVQGMLNDTNINSLRKKMFYDFLGNFGLTSAISLIRIPLMSMDKIIAHGIQLNLFTMPLLLSIATTSANFTWYEFQGRINKETHPISHFLFNRVGELRTVVLVTFASAAALLNPASFGMLPWITLSVVGAGGLVSYFKGAELKDWVEKSPFFKGLLGRIVEMNGGIITTGGLTCRALFE